MAFDRRVTELVADIEDWAETNARHHKQSKDEDREFEKWAKGERLLITVQVSAKRYMVVRPNGYTYHREGMAYRGSEVMFGPATREACHKYIDEGGTLIPAGIKGHNPAHPYHQKDES